MSSENVMKKIAKDVVDSKSRAANLVMAVAAGMPESKSEHAVMGTTSVASVVALELLTEATPVGPALAVVRVGAELIGASLAVCGIKSLVQGRRNWLRVITGPTIKIEEEAAPAEEKPEPVMGYCPECNGHVNTLNRYCTECGWDSEG